MRDRWNNRWRYIVFSFDCVAGVGVFIGVFVAAWTTPKLREEHLLDVTTGVSVAILAVVVAAFAILAAFLNEDYGVVIKESLGSVWRAFEPYAVVAVVSGTAASFSVLGLFLWPVFPAWLRALFLAAALGFATWAVVGTVQLVGITATHGRHRLRIPEIRAAASEARAKRRKASQ
jgi:hypothetical protein